MNTKKFIRVFFFCLLACFSAQVYAEVWSIQVIQHDGNKEDIRSSSYLIEDSLMEFFFERGQIASTVPAVTSLGSAYDSKLEAKAIEEVSEGYCDYLIVLAVDYDTADSRNPAASILENISAIGWKVIEVSDGSVIASGRALPSTSKNSKDIVTFVREIAANIVASMR